MPCSNALQTLCIPSITRPELSKMIGQLRSALLIKRFGQVQQGAGHSRHAALDWTVGSGTALESLVIVTSN